MCIKLAWFPGLVSSIDWAKSTFSSKTLQGVSGVYNIRGYRNLELQCVLFVGYADRIWHCRWLFLNHIDAIFIRLRGGFLLRNRRWNWFLNRSDWNFWFIWGIRDLLTDLYLLYLLLLDDVFGLGLGLIHDYISGLVRFNQFSRLLLLDEIISENTTYKTDYTRCGCRFRDCLFCILVRQIFCYLTIHCSLCILSSETSTEISKGWGNGGLEMLSLSISELKIWFLRSEPSYEILDEGSFPGL